jgi:serine/threonine protein kinase
MCYELLVGQPPFSSRTLAEMAMKHVLEPPSPLADIPASLVSAIAKSLGKTPIERPPAAVLAIALREAARVAPNARARALEIPDHQKLNPLGASSGGSPSGGKSSASSSGSRAVVLDSHQAATVLSQNAGKDVEALVKASRARSSLAGAPTTSLRAPERKPLSLAVLIALGGFGALLGWLLQR